MADTDSGRSGSEGNSASAGTTETMDRKLGIIAMLIATTGMGMSGLLARGATRLNIFEPTLAAGQSIGAFMTVGRMIVGLLFFVALLLLTHRVSDFRRTKLSPAIVLSGLTVGVALAFYQVSGLLTSIANSVFLIYTGPLFCTILARIFRKEPITGFQGICLAAVFVGMLLTSGIVSWGASGLVVSLDLSLSTPEFPHKGIGDLFGLVSGVFYGTSLFFNGYRKDVDSVVRNVWNFSFSTIGSLVVALSMTAVWPLGDVSMTGANWAWAVGLWIICGPIGLGLVLVGGRNLIAVEYATVGYWECVVACLIGVLVFHETWTMATVLGGLLIMGGGAAPVVQALLKSPKKSRSADASR